MSQKEQNKQQPEYDVTPPEHDAESVDQPEDIAEDLPDQAEAPAKEKSAPTSEDAIHELRQQTDELQSRLLRSMADYQNLARRAEQNVVIAREQALIDFARQLVTVLDHFDRALEVDPDKASVQSVLDGLNMVRAELMRALQQFGIQRLDVQAGEPFDPNKHEAMMRQETQEIQTNHVVMQLQPGYMIKDKVVRPAKVAVAQ